jgi:hypothetical protein
MSTHLRWRWLPALWIVIAWGTRVTADDFSPDNIVKAMRDREAAARTVDAQIEEQYLLIPPRNVALAPQADGATDLERRTHEIVIKDTKMFRKLRGVVWSHVLGRPILQEMTSTFDGDQGKSLYTTTEYRLGFNHGDRHHADRYSLHVLPVTGHFRGLAKDMEVYRPDKWNVVATDIVIDDAKCVQICEGSKEEVRYRELWFDVEKGYALVRRRDVFRGKTENALTVSYETREPLGWVPTGWRVDRYADGRLIDHSVAKVVSLRINEAVDELRFDLEFPAGTKVNGVLPSKRDEKKP